MSEQRKTVDWEAIEREYRAGQLSLREIGRIHDVSDTAIRKKAKAEGWQRDLTEKVREAVRTKLVRELSGSQNGSQEQREANDREIVEETSDRGVALVRSHQKSLARGHGIVMKLLAELEEATDDRVEIEEAIEQETEADRDPKRRNQMLRAVNLGSRAATVRELSMAIKNLIPLERQAFGLNAIADEGKDTLAALISKSLENS